MGWILWTLHKNTAIKCSIPKQSSSFPLLHNAFKTIRSWLEKLKTTVEKDRWKLCLVHAEGYRSPFEFVLRCWLSPRSVTRPREQIIPQTWMWFILRDPLLSQTLPGVQGELTHVPGEAKCLQQCYRGICNPLQQSFKLEGQPFPHRHLTKIPANFYLRSIYSVTPH